MRDIKGFKRNLKKSYTVIYISPSKVPIILGGSRWSIVLQKAALILTVLICVVLFISDDIVIPLKDQIESKIKVSIADTYMIYV